MDNKLIDRIFTNLHIDNPKITREQVVHCYIRKKIIEYLPTPKPLIECNMYSIGVETEEFFTVWREMRKQGELIFTEGGKNFQPIMVSLKEGVQ